MSDRCLEAWWRQQATSAHRRTWRTRLRVPLVRTDGFSVCLEHHSEGRGLSRVAGPAMAGAPRACSRRLGSGPCGCHRSAGCSRVRAYRRPHHPCVQRRFPNRSSRAPAVAAPAGSELAAAGTAAGPVVAARAGKPCHWHRSRRASLDLEDMGVFVVGLSAEEMQSLRAAVHS